MTPEEQLDRLIKQWERGTLLEPVTSDEIEARFAAARALAQLQTIEVPSAFAAHLEARLRVRARQVARQNHHEIAIPRPQRRIKSRRWLGGRAWVTGFGIAAVFLLMCIGAFTVAAQSLPGDPLYSLKQLGQQVTLAFASGQQDHAQVVISQLRTALDDLRAVINERRPDENIAEALGVAADKTRESQDAVAALPPGPDQAAAQRDLASVLATEDKLLRTLLAQLDWPLRLRFTQQLHALGDAVPTIAQVTVSRPTQNQLQITITGTNFAPGATLMINGVPKGAVSKKSATQLVALLNLSDWPGGTRLVGVLNPDGTAAQVTFNNKGDGDGDEDDQNGSDATPGTTSTPDPGGDAGDDRDEPGGSGGSSSTPTPTPSPGDSSSTPTPPPDH